MSPPIRHQKSLAQYVGINTVITTMAAAIIAMSGFWMVEGRNFVSREEMAKSLHEEMERTVKENPYIIDKSGINELLNVLKRDSDRTSGKLGELSQNITELKLEIAKIQTKLEQPKVK